MKIELTDKNQGTYKGIVRHAYEHFMRTSYHVSSVRYITGSAKICRAAVYHYVDSKQELLISVCKHFAKSLLRYKMLLEGALTLKQFTELDISFEKNRKKRSAMKRLAAVVLMFELPKNRAKWTIENDLIALLPNGYEAEDILALVNQIETKYT